MTPTPLEAWADVLAERLGTSRRVEVYHQTASTQDAARRLAEAAPDTADGALVAAGHQTAGRGRLGRAWHSPAGTASTFSLVHRTTPGSLDRVAFAVSVALSTALDEFLRPIRRATTIKWPNDLYADGRKLAGILVEAAGPWAIIGVGINVGVSVDELPQELRGRATSLRVCGVEADRLDVLVATVREIERALAEPDHEQLLRSWRAKCGMLHQHVRLGHDGQVIEGTVIDLDPREGLVVRRISGEIVHLPAATTTVL